MVGRRLCCAIVAALLGLVGAGEGAEAQEPVITVTPDTDLTSGQVVTVTSSGWSTSHYVVAGQCLAEAEHAEDLFGMCNDRNLYDPAPDGTLTFDYRVRRLVPHYDCAVEACIILVFDYDANVKAVAPLHFLPVTRQVTVTPQTGLSDPDVVTVAGEGFTDELGNILQCEDEAKTVTSFTERADFCGGLAAVYPTRDGTFSTQYEVARHRPTYSREGTVNCGETPSDCFIWILQDGLGLEMPITFASSQFPIALPGGATVTEGDGGSDVVSVPVTLSFAPEQEVTVEWQTVFDPAWSEIAAMPGVDYVAASGQLVFEPGDMEEHAQIVITPDVNAELDELLVVSFNRPTNARMGGYWGLGFGGILDDDSPTQMTGPIISGPVADASTRG